MIMNNDFYEEKAKEPVADDAVEENNNENFEMSETAENIQEENVEIPAAAEVPHYDTLAMPEPAILTKPAGNEPLPWLSSEEVEDLRSRWKSIQIEFVDEPRTSVEKASALVSEALKRIEQVHTNKQTILAERWNNHEEISTEDLRVAIQSYRLFLNRLLA